MNKYQESLNYIIDKYIDMHYECQAMNEDTKHALRLQELVDKAESFEWIPFEMEEGFLYCQIPDVDEEILVTDGKHVWQDTWIEYDDGYALDSNYELDEVTAWMPLPKPYKEKENDDIR